MNKLHLTVMIIVALAFMAMPSAAQANLLQNPGFEDVTDWIPDYWTMTGDANYQTWPDFSERVTGVAGIGIWAWSNGGEVSQEVTGLLGGEYTYTIWTKRDGGTPEGEYYMKLAWWDDSDFISEDQRTIILTDSWAQQNESFTSPAGTTKAYIMFGHTDDTTLVSKWDDADFSGPAVPEPASLVLLGSLGSGLAGLSAVHRKKRS